MRAVAIVLGVALALGMTGSRASAEGLIAQFNAGAGELPEGIAVDRAGALYVSLAPTGEIRRQASDGTWSTLHRFTPDSHGGLAVLGLAADRSGNLFVAVPSDAPSEHGVWRISASGAATRIPGTEAIAFPNGIALDGRGSTYVTDSVGGTIWRIGSDGHVTPWMSDPLLAGTGLLNGPGAPIGANGIAYERGALVVANTEQRIILDIPIGDGGVPGVPQIRHAYAEPLDLLDGVVVDVVGNAYAVVHGRRVDRISPHGSVTTVATYEDHDLVVPASLAFGTRGTAKRVLYVTYLSLPPLVRLAFPEGGVGPMPGIVAIEVSLPGPPLR